MPTEEGKKDKGTVVFDLAHKALTPVNTIGRMAIPHE
jgi:hypothetical protein